MDHTATDEPEIDVDPGIATLTHLQQRLEQLTHDLHARGLRRRAAAPRVLAELRQLRSEIREKSQRLDEVRELRLLNLHAPTVEELPIEVAPIAPPAPARPTRVLPTMRQVTGRNASGLATVDAPPTVEIRTIPTPTPTPTRPTVKPAPRSLMTSTRRRPGLDVPSESTLKAKAKFVLSTPELAPELYSQTRRRSLITQRVLTTLIVGSLTVSVVGLFTFLAIDLCWSTINVRRLENLSADPSTSKPKLEKALTERHSAWLDRFNGRRDYAVAWALDRTTGEKVEPVVWNVTRAVDRSPANVWYRLALTDLPIDNSVKEKAWDELATLPIADHRYWQKVAMHHLYTGAKDEALEASREVVKHRPELTQEMLTKLSAAGVRKDQALAIAPNTAKGMLGATKFLESQQDPRWRRWLEPKLDQLNRKPSLTAEEDADRATLAQMLGRDQEATTAIQSALRRLPEKREWQFMLAQMYYRQEKYHEAAELAAKVNQADPTGPLAEKARLLKEQITIATGNK